MTDQEELAREWLPTTLSRWVAKVTATTGIASLFLPEFLQKIGLQIKDIAKPEFRLLFLTIILFLGSFVLLILALRHIKELNAEFDVLKQKYLGTPKYTKSRDPSERLDDIKERVLLYVTENPGKTSGEIAYSIQCGEPFVLHQLDELLIVQYVKEAHIQGSSWEEIQYRLEWNCDIEGRKYLAHYGLLK